MESNKNTLQYWINRAQQIATEAHKGQTRRGGDPYITHPTRIAAKAEDRLKPIAFLHDVPEESDVTLQDLEKDGFPSYIIKAVDLLTHKEGDSNAVYWKKILTNQDAIKIKLLDIEDNLASNPSDHAKQKYARALELFKKAGYTL